MSINQLQLEARKLQIQLNAMAAGTPDYYRVLAQYEHITTALGMARTGIQKLSF